MLDDLLRIKRRREDAAVAAQAAAKRDLEGKQVALQEKTRELEEYRVRQAEEKTRLYANVHRRSVTKSNLTDYREQVGLMRQRQLALEEERSEAERAVDAARDELERARQRRADASAEVVKLEEYHAALGREEQRVAERKENDEADEYRGRGSQGRGFP